MENSGISMQMVMIGGIASGARTPRCLLAECISLPGATVGYCPPYGKYCPLLSGSQVWGCRSNSHCQFQVRTRHSLFKVSILTFHISYPYLHQVVFHSTFYSFNAAESAGKTVK